MKPVIPSTCAAGKTARLGFLSNLLSFVVKGARIIKKNDAN